MNAPAADQAIDRHRRPGLARVLRGGLGAVLLACAAGGWALATGAPALAATDPLPSASVGVRHGAPMITPEPWHPTLPAGATPRAFVTRDAITLDGVQYLARSRGTLVLVHGPGPVDRALAAWAPWLQSASGMHVIGVALSGFGRSDGHSVAFPAGDAFVEDLGAVVRELKRRMPSGPVIFVAPTAGAGLAIRFVDRSGLPTATERGLRRPDGLVLIHPVLTLDALAGDTVGGLTGVAWHRRRLAIQRRLPWLDWITRLPVAHAVVSTERGPVVQHLSFATVQSLRTDGDPWHTLARSDVPMLLLSAVPPDTTELPPAEHRLWQQVPPGTPLPGPALTQLLTAWLSRFAGDAEERPSSLPYQLLPILPPR